MTTEIAKTPFYTIGVDTLKNRGYLAIFGFWRSPSDVPNYLDDWQKTVKQLRPGFTVLTDVTQMKTSPPEIKKLHEKAQSILVAAGLARTAEVYSEEEAALLKIQLNTLAASSKMSKANFTHRQEAEAWLDKESATLPQG